MTNFLGVVKECINHIKKKDKRKIYSSETTQNRGIPSVLKGNNKNKISEKVTLLGENAGKIKIISRDCREENEIQNKMIKEFSDNRDAS